MQARVCPPPLMGNGLMLVVEPEPSRTFPASHQSRASATFLQVIKAQAKCSMAR